MGNWIRTGESQGDERGGEGEDGLEEQVENKHVEYHYQTAALLL